MPLLILIVLTVIVVKICMKSAYNKLQKEALNELGFSDWNIISYIDDNVTVKSRQALEKFDDLKYFKENREKLLRAVNVTKRKAEVEKKLKTFLAKIASASWTPA